MQNKKLFNALQEKIIGCIFKTPRFPSRSTVLRKSIAIPIYLKIILILEPGGSWSDLELPKKQTCFVLDGLSIVDDKIVFQCTAMDRPPTVPGY